MNNRTWIAIPDLQIPFHDPDFVDALVRLVERVRPHGLLCVGDEIDLPQPSRWSKGWAEEFEPTLKKDIKQTVGVMGRFRKALGDKPFHVMRSNHGERLEKYVRRYAPALSSLDELSYPRLLQYDKMGISYHKTPFRFAPGWVMAHGDEGGLRKHAGWTAMGLVDRWGVSVMCGHTHRMGLLPVSRGYAGRVKALWACEVGHGMLLSKAHYMPAGSANWQAGTVMVRVSNGKVNPILLPYDKGFVL